ncbi:hypothetical protein Tco_1161314 [Tanacetum coccineum]
MTSLADKSLLSGGDNKPPMLEKHLYDSWKSRMELYMMNRPHGRMILASVEKGPLVWPSITEDGVTRLKEYVELTPAEAIQVDCDIAKLLKYHLQAYQTLTSIALFKSETKFLNTLPDEWSKFGTDVNWSKIDTTMGWKNEKKCKDKGENKEASYIMARIKEQVSLRIILSIVLETSEEFIPNEMGKSAESHNIKQAPCRFNTTAGNPVKKILLKLNLSDHRLCKMVVEVPDSSWLTRSITTCSYPTDKHKVIMKAQVHVSRLPLL